MAVVHTIPEGDLDLASGGFAMVSGSEMVRQNIRSRFRFFLGEWFLDLRQGVPYYRDVLVKNPDLEVIQSVFRRVLLKTPGVLSILRFALVYEATDRVLRFDFEVQSTDGPIAVEPNDATFIVSL